MNKKTKIIIGVSGVATIIIAGIAGYFLLDKKNKQKPIASVAELSKAVFENYTNMDLATKDFEAIYPEKITDMNSFPFTKDGKYGSKLTSDEKNGENLSEYEKAQDKYLKNLQEAVKGNFKHNIKKETEMSPKSIEQTINFSGYLLYQYNIDFDTVYNTILDGYYNLENVANNSEKLNEKQQKEFKVALYKAKVKTLEIMNEELDRYKNEKLNQDTKIYFANNSKEEGNDWKIVNLSEVYNNFLGRGYAVDTEDKDNESFNNDFVKRIQEIFDKSYNKYINPKDYLHLGEYQGEKENS